MIGVDQSSSQEKLDQICQRIQSASFLKQSLVGSPLEAIELNAHRIEGSSKADFTGLIAVFYTVWKDRWQADRSLFEKYDARLIEFDRHFLDLRTPFFHAGASMHQQSHRDEWVKEHWGPEGWGDCIEAFLDEVIPVVELLIDVFQQARANSNLIDLWRRQEAHSPESSVLAMADVLGMRLDSKRLAHKVRSVTQRINKSPPASGQELTAVMDAYAVQELVSWFGPRPLSVDYVDLLNEFDLAGRRNAREFIWLAHVVEGVTGHRRRDELLPVLHDAWDLMLARRSRRRGRYY